MLYIVMYVIGGFCWYFLLFLYPLNDVFKLHSINIHTTESIAISVSDWDFRNVQFEPFFKIRFD